MHRARFEERLLHGMELIAMREALNGGDLPLSDRSHLRNARALGFPVHQDGASAALTLTAAILAAGQIEVVTQDGKKTGLRICVDRVRTSVYSEANRSHSETPVRNAFEDLERTLQQMIYPLISARD